MARYGLVVWDFDGTLADTGPIALRTYNAVAPRYGCKPVGDVEVARAMTTRQFLRTHKINMFRLPRLVRGYLAAVAGEMPGVRLFPGIEDVLRTLKGRGLRLGVLSSNSTENITACLRANGVDGLFDFITGYPRLFGKARGLRRLLRANRIEAGHVLYVGDEVRDVVATRKVGVDIASVCWGFQPRATLANHGPTYLLDSPPEVASLVLGSALDGLGTPAGRTVLFLCTGNYYRSRYAELLFNHLAAARGLDWRAASRGLALERGAANVGPLSKAIAEVLKARGIRSDQVGRFPLQLLSAELSQACHVVALKEAEHRPLLRDRHAGWEDRVEYWHVHDTDAGTVAEAVAGIDRQVGALVARLAGR
jgi:phosphoglycolate phosphatase-like HAD superfamily hydrolase/protein-tyrosine-phosphatase